MNALEEQIIAVYAEQGVDGVQVDDSFKELCQQHIDDTGFSSIVYRVSDVAKDLDDALDGQTHRSQVEFALRVLNAYRRHPAISGTTYSERGICRELTRLRFAKHWSPEQREYYDEESEKLVAWRDYFLSFTNHNPTMGEVMFVNLKYRRLIEMGLGRRFGSRQMRGGELARAPALVPAEERGTRRVLRSGGPRPGLRRGAPGAGGPHLVHLRPAPS